MNIVSRTIWSFSEEETLRLYYPSVSTVEIQKLLPERTLQSIYQQASRLGIKRDSYIYWTEEENVIIRSQYPTLGYQKIRALLPGRTGRAIACQAALLGVQVLPDYRRRLELGNLNFFSTPTPLSSYWAGFIAADGCITEKNKLQIAICDLDKNHLERFCFDIGYFRSLKVHKNMGKGSYLVKFVLRSVTIVEALERNYNIKPRKTFDLDFPQHLNFENQATFIAGIIDGDGCIRLNESKSSQLKCYLSIKIVGTFNELEGIKRFADTHTPINPRVASICSSVLPYSSIYVYRLSGYRALAFAELIMYICKDIPLLRRKWDFVIKYREIITKSGIQSNCLAAIPAKMDTR